MGASTSSSRRLREFPTRLSSAGSSPRRAASVASASNSSGLQGTITDVLVRVQTRDGARSTTLVRPSRPWVEIAATPGTFAVAATYLVHGIEHILLRLRPSAVRSRAHPHRAESAGAGRDGHGLHGGTLDHACAGDARRRARAGAAGGGRHRAQHSSARLRDRARRAANRVSRRAGPGWWRSRSASCTVSVSPARSPRSACHAATFRSRCSRSMSASRSDNSPSSPPCWHRWPSSDEFRSRPHGTSRPAGRDLRDRHARRVLVRRARRRISALKPTAREHGPLASVVF